GSGMETILEQQQQYHEERERLMDMRVREMLTKKSRLHDQIHSDHHTQAMQDRSMGVSSSLWELYDDKDGLREEELSAISGPNEFVEFYNRLKQIEEFHQKHPHEMNGFLRLTQEGPELAACAHCSHVTGYLDDCTCDVETIDAFNNYKLFPRLNELLQSDYFRYYKVNLQKPCPFWEDNSHCGMRDCAVQPCPSDEVPDGIRAGSYKYSEEANSLAEECEEAKRLGAVDDSLRKSGIRALSESFPLVFCSKETRQAVLQWAQHDDSSDSFCEADDIHSPDAEYVDLLLNPERYTGYKGPDAWKIWNSIYEENCFKPQNVKRPLASGRGHTFYKWLKGVCVEKRAFYRLISGLHASINIHLSAGYLLQDSWSEKKWGPNVTEFQQRFDEALTSGEGPRRLKNLYFLYLIELRALSKVLPFFERPGFQLYTGNERQDAEMKHLLLEILHLAKLHFKNISKIMDCVGCFKCRLWGKLQTQGLGTALKILFSENLIEKIPESGPSYGFQLTRQEIVALFNAFGRVSTSVKELENFRNLLQNMR
ncbi:hypothetical protein EK904_003795, partial [Melospiza melodia maxima]